MSKVVYCENCVHNAGTKESPSCELHTALGSVGGFCSDGQVDKSKQESILIYNPKIARKLLKAGYTIVDIKPDRSNPIRTIHVFKMADGLLDLVYEKKELEKEKTE